MRIDYSGIAHKNHLEKHRMEGSQLRDLILGGQDGLVNVLGLVLGVASATNDARIVLVAGFAALAAESISMAAVAYTSAKAARSFYESEKAREYQEVEETPEEEREEIRRIYRAKGFSGKLLEQIVKHITEDKDRWVDVMMKDELNLSEEDHKDPLQEAWVVGVSTVVGSAVPLLPFFLLPMASAMPTAVVLSCLVLFGAGAYKAQVTVGVWWKSGIEMALIGLTAAVLGYLIGAWAGASPLFG